MNIVEINNSNIAPSKFIKGFLTKRSRDVTSYPKIVVRQSNFDFNQKKIDYFAQLAGFKSDSKLLPAIYIQLMGFKLQLELLFHEDFPFPAMGMVNMSNKIVQIRPFELSEIKKVECYFDEPKNHKRGILYTVLTKAYDVNNMVVGENYAEHIILLKELKNKQSATKTQFTAIEGKETEFAFYGDSGRKFAKITGDINPIHLYAITAKLFGFKKQIAHGTFSTSRALAQLEKELPALNSFEFYTEYKQPLFLPSVAKFISLKKSENEIEFELVNSNKTKPHMVGYFKSK